MTVHTLARQSTCPVTATDFFDGGLIRVQMTDGEETLALMGCRRINALCFPQRLFINLPNTRPSRQIRGTSGLPASSLGCGVVDLAHEQDALRGVLQDQDQERPVQPHDFGHAHGHDLDGGAGGCLGSCLIDVQHGAVGHLWSYNDTLTFELVEIVRTRAVEPCLPWRP